MTESIDAIRSRRDSEDQAYAWHVYGYVVKDGVVERVSHQQPIEHSAERALSDLAYAVQSLRRVPGMTPDQAKRLFTMSCEIDSIYVQIGEGK